jgi:hypothetical protein
MALLSIEIISLLITIVTIMRFNLNQKFTSWMLKGVKIFLPPSDKDYELIQEIKKDRNKNSQANAIVRTCDVHEYIKVIKDENISETDSVTFFYLVSVVNLIFIEGVKIFNFVFQKYFVNLSNSEENKFEEDSFTAKNNLNVVTSFVIITIFYIFYTNIKIIFKGGYKSYEARIFYLNTIIFFITSFIILSFFESVFNINHINICETVNDRLEQIMIQADQSTGYRHLPDIVLCNKKSLNAFYAFFISIFIASVFRSSLRLATFDDFLINASEKANSIFKEVKDKKVQDETSRIQLISKLKQILNAFILLLFIDPLFKNYLTENKIISDLSFNLYIILPLILVEVAFNAYLTKFYSTLFLNQNYYDMVDFCKTADKNQLNLIRTKMDYLNKKFWEIYLHLFNIMFSSLVLVLFYFNRSDIFTVMFDKKREEFKFKTNFIETLIFFGLFSVIFGKAVFGNLYTLYIKNFKNDRKVTFI